MTPELALHTLWVFSSIRTINHDSTTPGAILRLCPEGNYTYLYANFTFVRRISSSLLNVYIPSTLVVFLSWISFWLDVAAVPARITLGVTSLLTLATQVVQARGGLPTISYMTAMDIWLFVCLLTVFSSLLEFAFTYQLYYLNKKRFVFDQQNQENIQFKKDIRKEDLRLRKSPKILIAHSGLKSSRRINFEQDRDSPSSNNAYLSERTLDSYCRKLFPLVFAIFALIYWTYYLWLK
ncbi:glutamate-gated chloride channel [Trichonephila clavipes]|nr:glutamate-gated chloride channel [Trichonephila clavipes]